MLKARRNILSGSIPLRLSQRKTMTNGAQIRSLQKCVLRLTILTVLFEYGLKTDDGNLALARLVFGNVVLIPQTAAGLGDDDFRIVHGTDVAPPHNYVASYLWARHGFGADALIHFGAHGNLEFTPRKQVALGSEDWPDRLVGTMPHFYVYSTSNVGEAMTAKRRSYAGIINYLTPPFMESEVEGYLQKSQ